MANVSNLENRLTQIIEQDEPVAIALTGEWGIGKTHFWKNFYERRHQDLKLYAEKYAYVSLFGIDSLETLKYEIAIQSHDTIQQKNHLSQVKSLFTNLFKHVSFPKIESNGFSMAISQSMVNTLIGNMVKNTLICIDDFERKSDKLAVKDIMGVINDLKEQKNCKVVVILHSDKLNSEFAEYKEKVFDDILYFDDNLDLLREVVNNDEIFDIYEHFYNCLKIKNLRFYKKVHQIYLELVKLDKGFSLTSKRAILENLLLIKMVQNFPIKLKYEYKNQQEEFEVDTEFLSEEIVRYMRGHDDEFFVSQNKIDTFNQHLNNFIMFQGLDDWGRLIITYITDSKVNQELLNKLSHDDIFSEKTLEKQRQHKQLLDELYSLNPNENFIQRFYESALTQINIERLSSLGYEYEIIKKGNQQLAQDFYRQVCDYVVQYLNMNYQDKIFHKNGAEFHFFNDQNVFYDFVNQTIENHNQNIINHNLHQKIIDAILDGRTGFTTQENLQKIMNELKKDDIEKIIWYEYDVEEIRLYRTEYIQKILNSHLFSDEKRDEVRQWIIELLNEKMEKNENAKPVILNFLDFTDNLTKK